METSSEETPDEDLLGTDPDTGGEVYFKDGRFGPYVQLATGEGKPKNVSLLNDMSPADMTLELALKLLSLPRNLGENPDSKEPVMAHTGRYGPYIKCGTETRSLPSDISPLDVELGQALLLLAQPKQRKGQGGGNAIREFGQKSPVTGNELRILEGKYGPYITDGETNASVPKGSDPQEVTFDDAVTLLATRAARGKGKKKSPKKKAAPAADPAPAPRIEPSDEPPF